MTLLLRLLIVALLGLGLFFGYVTWGEPTLRAMAIQQQHSPGADGVPQQIARLFGKYTSANADGRYVLILDGSGAELRFTDIKHQEYAYRGHYTVDGSSLEVAWSEQRDGKQWKTMQSVVDKMKVTSTDTIEATEGAFSRSKH
ncbi:hypothetical protein [Burkholderia multivorans]|uniref:hypothetical protein n=1 Tax=Burkholderia multivorans TaxID=87883 RepID=UPI00351014B4